MREFKYIEVPTYSLQRASFTRKTAAVVPPARRQLLAAAALTLAVAACTGTETVAPKHSVCPKCLWLFTSLIPRK